ncbi:TPA: hypothetical protein R4229_003532 [Morganella morganii]|nr:hypothetical protein [Morganella morganii]
MNMMPAYLLKNQIDFNEMGNIYFMRSILDGPSSTIYSESISPENLLYIIDVLSIKKHNFVRFENTDKDISITIETEVFLYSISNWFTNIQYGIKHNNKFTLHMNESLMKFQENIPHHIKIQAKKLKRDNKIKLGLGAILSDKGFSEREEIISRTLSIEYLLTKMIINATNGDNYVEIKKIIKKKK